MKKVTFDAADVSLNPSTYTISSVITPPKLKGKAFWLGPDGRMYVIDERNNLIKISEEFE